MGGNLDGGVAGGAAGPGKSRQSGFLVLHAESTPCYVLVVLLLVLLPHWDVGCRATSLLQCLCSSSSCVC